MKKNQLKRHVVLGTLIAISAALSGISQAQAAGIAWKHDWSSAKKTAKNSGKLLMIDMYTDWCTWCKKLDSDVYPNAAVVKAASSFVPVRLNAEQEGQSLARQYKVTGYPTILFLDSSGAVVDRIGGYLPAAKFATYIKDITRNYRQFPTLQARIRRNPHDAAAGRQLSLLLIRRERMPEALKVLNNIDNSSTRSTLGSLYNAVGDYYTQNDQGDNGLKWYRKTIAYSKTPNELIEAHLSAFSVYAGQGDKAAMKSELQSILKMPSAPQALKAQAREILKQIDNPTRP